MFYYLLALIDFLHIFQFCFKPAKDFKEFFRQHSPEARSVYHTVKAAQRQHTRTLYCFYNAFSYMYVTLGFLIIHYYITVYL